MSQLQMENVKTLLGDGPKEMARDIMSILKSTKLSPYFVGPSGVGKTHTGMFLVKAYVNMMKKQGVEVPGYFIQLSPDQTKTSVIGGHRLIKGSLESVNGVFANCMEQGGIIYVDEVTHATQEMMLMFNSALDRTAVTSVGDRSVVAHENFRAMFGSNTSRYAGNNRLPQSFAQRMVAFPFDYPSIEDEITIARGIVVDELGRDTVVPNSVIRYLSTIAREVREQRDNFPLSARNIASATMVMDLALKRSGDVDEYFTGANVESTRRNLAQRILSHEPTGTMDLNQGPVGEFIRFVSSIGIEKFRQAVLGSFMYYLDVDGSELVRDQLRADMASSII